MKQENKLTIEDLIQIRLKSLDPSISTLRILVIVFLLLLFLSCNLSIITSTRFDLYQRNNPLLTIVIIILIELFFIGFFLWITKKEIEPHQYNIFKEYVEQNILKIKDNWNNRTLILRVPTTHSVGVDTLYDSPSFLFVILRGNLILIIDKSFVQRVRISRDSVMDFDTNNIIKYWNIVMEVSSNFHSKDPFHTLRVPQLGTNTKYYPDSMQIALFDLLFKEFSDVRFSNLNIGNSYNSLSITVIQFLKRYFDGFWKDRFNDDLSYYLKPHPILKSSSSHINWKIFLSIITTALVIFHIVMYYILSANPYALITPIIYLAVFVPLSVLLLIYIGKKMFFRYSSIKKDNNPIINIYLSNKELCNKEWKLKNIIYSAKQDKPYFFPTHFVTIAESTRFLFVLNKESEMLKIIDKEKVTKLEIYREKYPSSKLYPESFEYQHNYIKRTIKQEECWIVKFLLNDESLEQLNIVVSTSIHSKPDLEAEAFIKRLEDQFYDREIMKHY